MVENLIAICDLLGVSYDRSYLDTLSDKCQKVDYLLFQIRVFLGA